MSKTSDDSDESDSMSNKRLSLPKRADRIRTPDAPDSSTDEEPEVKSDDETSPSTTWNCSLCTYKNSAGAFRCSICDSPKGTSTRKPRINSQMVVAQQVARQQQQQIQQQLLKSREKEGREKVDRKRSVRETSPSSSIGAESTCSESKRPNEDADLSPPPGMSMIKMEKPKKKDSKNSTKSSISKDKFTSASNLARSKKIDFNLKNIDRNSCISRPVRVNNVTVIITEFWAKKSAPKKKKKKRLEDVSSQSNSTHDENEIGSTHE